jgi:hypothetical protein
VYNLITALTESSLTRYKPMSFKAIWEEGMNKSLGIEMSSSSTAVTPRSTAAAEAEDNFSSL